MSQAHIHFKFTCGTVRYKQEQENLTDLKNTYSELETTVHLV